MVGWIKACTNRKTKHKVLLRRPLNWLWRKENKILTVINSLRSTRSKFVPGDT